MKLNTIVITAVVATLALAVSSPMVAAQPRQAQSQAKPDPAKPESKADAGVTGKWNVNVQGPNGAVESALDLKVDPKEPKKITGTITSQMGEAKVEGELADGKLTFWFSMDANGQTLNITFTGTQQKDGTLAGTLSFGQGDMTWTATRAKN